METVFSKSKMTSKGQLTLPKKVRDYLDAKIGDNIIFELINEKLIIKKYEGIEKSNYVFYIEKGDYFYRVIELYKKNPSIDIKKIMIAEETRDRKINKIITMDKSFEKLNISIIKNI